MASYRTIQHTNLVMEKQKEEEELNSVKKIVEQVEIITSTAEPVLTDALGPEGLALFVQKCNGSITISQSGFEILSILMPDDVSNSVSNYLLNFLRKINSNIGDGIKRFIFYIKALIMLLNHDSDVYLRLKQLKKFQSVINLTESNYNCISGIDCFSKSKLDSFIKSFFLTRFTLTVANFFSQLVFHWIISYNVQESCDSISKDTIKLLLDYIDVLCFIKTNQLPITESNIQQGFVVTGKINGGYQNFKQSKYILKVFLYSHEDVDVESEDSRSFESDIPRLLSEIKFQDGSYQILLVTNVILSDSLLFYCHLRNIISIEGVLVENVKFLNDYLLKNFLSKEFVTDIRCENSNSVWISIPGISQLLLCSPTKNLGIQLRNSLINLLTAISFSFIYKNCICDVNGNFESLFLQSLLTVCNKNIKVNPSKFVSNKVELMDWLNIKSSCKKDLSCTVCNSKLKILEGDSLSNFDDDIVRLKKFVSYLSSCISDQIDLTANDFMSFICDVLYYLVKKIKPKDKKLNFLDLVSVKLAVLSYAIQFILSIYNINSVIFTKR